MKSRRLRKRPPKTDPKNSLSTTALRALVDNVVLSSREFCEHSEALLTLPWTLEKDTTDEALRMGIAVTGSQAQLLNDLMSTIETLALQLTVVLNAVDEVV